MREARNINDAFFIEYRAAGGICRAVVDPERLIGFVEGFYFCGDGGNGCCVVFFCVGRHSDTSSLLAGGRTSSLGLILLLRSKSQEVESLSFRERENRRDNSFGEVEVLMNVKQRPSLSSLEKFLRLLCAIMLLQQRTM